MREPEDADGGEVTEVSTTERLACLGLGQVVYVREVEGQDVLMRFPDVPGIRPDSRVFVLYGADGLPLMLSDSRARLVASAQEYSLKTVSVH